MPAITMEKGRAVTLPVNAFTLSKELFLEWNTKKNGSGKSCKGSARITVNRDTTLFAQWGKLALKLSKVSSFRKGKMLTLKTTVTAKHKAKVKK